MQTDKDKRNEDIYVVDDRLHIPEYIKNMTPEELMEAADRILAEEKKKKQHDA